MAYSIFTYIAFFSLISNFCHSFNPKLLNVSRVSVQSGSDWLTTYATWYGDPLGAGTDGGSCGYEKTVASQPFNSLITAVAPSLYNSGNGCGTCYQVKCNNEELCADAAVTVVATDSCPGCDHLFDLSGTSFGAMAKEGKENPLRNIGTLEIQYRSMECNYPGVNIAFRVDPGSNANYFAAAIEYHNGDGITGVEIRQANTPGAWIPMQPSWGSVWKVNFQNGYSPPFSIKITEVSSKTVVAEGVIPAKYVANMLYRSVVNFDI